MKRERISFRPSPHLLRPKMSRFRSSSYENLSDRLRDHPSIDQKPPLLYLGQILQCKLRCSSGCPEASFCKLQLLDEEQIPLASTPKISAGCMAMDALGGAIWDEPFSFEIGSDHTFEQEETGRSKSDIRRSELWPRYGLLVDVFPGRKRRCCLNGPAVPIGSAVFPLRELHWTNAIRGSIESKPFTQALLQNGFQFCSGPDAILATVTVELGVTDAELGMRDERQISLSSP